MRVEAEAGAARLHRTEGRVEKLETDPRLARAYLNARTLAPYSSTAEVLHVTHVGDAGKLVDLGAPASWAPGVAQRILDGELKLDCECYRRPAPAGVTGLEPSVTPRRRNIAGSVLGKLKVGVHADRGGCSYMEDENLYYFPATADYAFCCVYDGHGGSQASHFLREQLHFNVMASDAFVNGHMSEALLEGFGKTERDLISEQIQERREQLASWTSNTSISSMLEQPSSPGPTGGAPGTPTQRSSAASSSGDLTVFAKMPRVVCCGSTALMLLIHGEHLHLAWLGDCRAVLSRGGVSQQLTKDHSLSCDFERARVLAEGGTVDGGRLSGFLQVARAFGDVDGASGQKPPGLSGLPELKSQPIHSDDEFVILGSDGLWDVIDADDAVRLARCELQTYGDAAMASEKLVEIALKRKTDDNVTAMVVCLNPIPQPVREQRPRLVLRKKTVQP